MITRTIEAGSTVTANPEEGFEYADYLMMLGNDGFRQGNVTLFQQLTASIHNANIHAGWWTDLVTGQPKERNVFELLCLIHSEVSEALEGHRKGLQDDKLPHRPMIEVELADTLIRIFDLAGALGLDLGGAMVEKLAFNANRADHKIENRLLADGKKA